MPILYNKPETKIKALNWLYSSVDFMYNIALIEISLVFSSIFILFSLQSKKEERKKEKETVRHAIA